MARLLIYDAYENKVYTYANLNENDPPDVKIGTTIFSKKAKNKPHKVSHWVKTIGKPYAAYSYLF